MLFKKFYKNQYVMNKTTGQAFRVTTGEVQSRGRYQLADLRGNTSPDYRTTYSNLVAITNFEAQICAAGEKIIRDKQAMSEMDATVVALHRALKAQIAG